MAVFTNIGKCRLVLPDGRGLEPGESAEVEASVLDYPVVAAWVEAKSASITDSVATEVAAPTPEEPKKARK